MEGGTYGLVLELARDIELEVGSLGKVRLPSGIYVYAGSAKVALLHRLERHARREKRVHWHIDRLTVLPSCCVLGAYVFGEGGPSECRLVELISKVEGAKVLPPGFGSSDHRCGGHLVHLPGGDMALEGMIALLGRTVPRGRWLPSDEIWRPGAP
jgi:Uri superfamily endonuclease